MSTAGSESPDVVLIGAGIMSATLGTVLKELEPGLEVVMFETLEDCAQESSQAWNNAGTGHAANCELNYTPQRSDGSIDISRALQVNTEFDISRQLWSHLVTKGAIPDPHAFIESCPHMSFVWGDENVAFLRDRYKAMSAHHCYHGMEYSEDHREIGQWVPLVMEGRDKTQPIAATRMITGTDIDYGALTHLLVSQLQAQPGFSVHYKHKVTDLNRLSDGRWKVGRGPAMIRCVRMWTGEDGDSLFEEGWIDLSKGTRGDCHRRARARRRAVLRRKRGRAVRTSGTRTRSRVSSSPCPARSSSKRSPVRRSPSAPATSCSRRTTAARATSGS